MARSKIRRVPKWIWWLTMLAAVIDFLATLSYATGAHMAVRFLFPLSGAWWNRNEFAFVECAATAFGMLAGIRLAARFVDGDALKNRAMTVSAIAGAVAMPPMARLGAQVSRYRFTSGAWLIERLIDRFGYDGGMLLDKILAAGVYSMKIAAFALPIGMILFALAIALFMTVELGSDPAQAVSK